MPPQPHLQAFRGTLIDCPSFGQVRVREDAICVVDQSLQGKIICIQDGSEEERVLEALGVQPGSVTRLKEYEVLLPGFVDLHLHAPQYAFTGTATDTPLMEWLKVLTFPTEGRMASNLGFAEQVFRAVVRRTLACGTTTAAYYGTLHLEPCKLLADIVEQLGQRAIVGKNSMDRNSPPDYLESTEEGLASCEAFVQYVLSKGLSRLAPAVTPRFVPTCTPALLRGCAEVACRHGGLHVQSHVSESYDAVAVVEELHPEVNGRDLEIFDQAGLLTPKTILAHAVLLSDIELRRMAASGAAIAHCPLSNMFFGDVIFRVRHALRLGVHVGLGTDVAGGYSPSMLNVMRQAVIASKALHAQTLSHAGDPAAAAAKCGAEGDPDALSWREALWLATMGGAEALQWQDRIGSFEEGKELDALLVDTSGAGVFDTFPSDSLMGRLEKVMTLGDDRNIAGVWVQGRRVKGG